MYASAKVYIWPATHILHAHIAGAPARNATTITYDAVAFGSYTDVIPGMTLLVHGVGVLDKDVRVRIKAITATTITVAENTIVWPAGGSVSVLKMFEPWSVLPFIDIVNGESIFYKDGNIPYTDQNQIMDPVPVVTPTNFAGPIGSTVQWDAQFSWDPQGYDLLEPVWTFEGGSPAIATGSTPPVVTYSEGGEYITSCTLTNTGGKSFTAYRHVYITNHPAPKYGLVQIDETRDSGATAKCWSRDVIPSDYTLIMITVNDEMFFSGYTYNRRHTWSAVDRNAEFDAVTPDLLADRMDVFDVSLQFRENTGRWTWWKLYRMTVDKAAVHLLRWHTNLLHLINFNSSGNTTYVKNINFARGKVFQSLRAVYNETLKASVTMSPLGEVQAEIDQNTYAVDARASRTYALDLRDQPSLTDDPIEEVSYMEIGGFAYSGATGTSTPYLSGAPGANSPGRFGSPSPQEGFAIPPSGGQEWLNDLSGMLYAMANNPYKELSAPLARQFLDVHVAPFKWYLINQDRMAPEVMFQKRFVLDRLTRKYDPRTLTLLGDATLRGETWGPPGETVTIPDAPQPEDPWYPPPILPPVLPPPATLGNAKGVWALYRSHGTGYFLVLTKNMRFNDANVDDCTWYNITPLPTGFDTPIDQRYLVGTPNGKVVALRGTNQDTWVCTNVAAIVAAANPSAVTAQWTKVTDTTAPLGGTSWHDLSRPWEYQSCVVMKGYVNSPNHHIYIELTSAGGVNITTSTSGVGNVTYAYGGDMYAAIETIYTNDRVLRVAKSLVLVRSYQPADAATLWRNSIGGTRYAALNLEAAPPAVWGIYNATTGALLYNAGASRVHTLSGAFGGPAVFAVLESGQGVIALDGASFVLTDLWNTGRIFDARYAGGGPLLWLSDAASYNEMARISTQNGAVGSFKNKTGNFWTVFPASALGNNFCGGIVTF